MESFLAVLNSVSSHRKKSTLGKGTPVKRIVEDAFCRYHMEHTQGDSFLMTITFPPHMSIMETWVRASIVQKDVIELMKNKEVFGGQRPVYCICAVEAHRGRMSKVSKVRYAYGV